MGPYWGFHDVSMFSVDFFMVTGLFSYELSVLFCQGAQGISEGSSGACWHVAHPQCWHGGCHHAARPHSYSS